MTLFMLSVAYREQDELSLSVCEPVSHPPEQRLLLPVTFSTRWMGFYSSTIQSCHPTPCELPHSWALCCCCSWCAETCSITKGVNDRQVGLVMNVYVWGRSTHIYIYTHTCTHVSMQQDEIQKVLKASPFFYLSCNFL